MPAKLLLVLVVACWLAIGLCGDGPSDIIHFPEVVDDGSRIDPKHVDDPQTHFLAFQQTLYARNLLYHPHENLTESLSIAGSSLLNFMRNITDPELLKALGARILNQEGILADKTTSDMIRAVEKVANNISDVTGTDRVVLIGLMGDFGALFTDTGATTGVYGRTPEQAEILREKFRAFANQSLLCPPDALSCEHIRKKVAHKGSDQVGPGKKVERARAKVYSKRSGIFDYGNLADSMLNVSPSEAIVKTKWAVAMISKRRLNTTEPWVGHMSGSPTEILLMWDVLDGEEENRQPWAQARAAGSAAFLVSMGYHSAMECIDATLAHLGNDIKTANMTDAAEIFHADAATKLLSDLFDDLTVEGKKIKLAVDFNKLLHI